MVQQKEVRGFLLPPVSFWGQHWELTLYYFIVWLSYWVIYREQLTIHPTLKELESHMQKAMKQLHPSGTGEGAALSCQVWDAHCPTSRAAWYWLDPNPGRALRARSHRRSQQWFQGEEADSGRMKRLAARRRWEALCLPGFRVSLRCSQTAQSSRIPQIIPAKRDVYKLDDTVHINH